MALGGELCTKTCLHTGSHKRPRPAGDGLPAHGAVQNALAAQPAGGQGAGAPASVSGPHPACSALHFRPPLQAPHLQMRWPQLRNVSRGACMHTKHEACAAAAPISLRAASMRRSVRTSLGGRMNDDDQGDVQGGDASGQRCSEGSAEARTPHDAERWDPAGPHLRRGTDASSSCTSPSSEPRSSCLQWGEWQGRRDPPQSEAQEQAVSGILLRACTQHQGTPHAVHACTPARRPQCTPGAR